MAAHTTRLNLYLPGGGSSGTITPDEPVDIDKINDNMRLLDDAIGFRIVTSGTRPTAPFIGQPIKETDTGDIRYWDGDSWEQLSGVPVGTIQLWPVATIPPGFLKCDGSSLLRASYPALFGLIGTTYGLGTDITTSTTFEVPDFSGRVAVGPGQVKDIKKAPQSGVDVSSNRLTIPDMQNFDWVTGQGVTLSSSGVMPGGLSAGTVYYLVKGTATTTAFATSRPNARAGILVDITSQGTGNISVEMSDNFTVSLAHPYGESTHQLLGVEMPGHQHAPGGGGNSYVSLGNGGGGLANITTGGGGYGLSPQSDVQGADASHNNVQPSLGMNYIIRATA